MPNNIDPVVIDIPDSQPVYACGSGTPFYFIKYVILVGISVIILTFCIYQIIAHPSDNNSVYFSLISVIIGIFAPSPSSKK